MERNTHMSFLRKALGTIVELDEAQTEAPKGPQPTGPSPAVIQATAASAPAPVGADAALQAVLMKVGLARKTVFSGMLEAAEQLRNVPGMTDMQRIQAAAAMGQATADTVKAAVQSHLSDLGAEKVKFTREIDAARSQRVLQALQGAEAHENGIADLQRQIDELQQRIVTSTSVAQQLRSDAAKADVELSTTVSTFDATYQAVEAFLVATRDSVISALKK